MVMVLTKAFKVLAKVLKGPAKVFMRRPKIFLGAATVAKAAVKVAKTAGKVVAKGPVKVIKALKASKKLKEVLVKANQVRQTISNIDDCDELIKFFEEETGLKPKDSGPSSARTKDGKYDLTLRESSSKGDKTMDAKDVITGFVTRVTCAVVKSRLKL